MKLFVRICCIAVAAALVLGVFAVLLYTGVSADGVSMSVQGATVYEGEDFSVDITLNREDVYGAQFTLSYDSDKLSIKSITTSLSDEDYVFYANKSKTENTFSVIVSGGVAIPSGVIATVNFTAGAVESDTVTPLSFTELYLSNSNYTYIAGATTAGSSVTIKYIENKPEKALKTYASSLTLTSDVTLNVYVEQSFATAYNFENLYMVFTIPGREITVYPQVYNAKYFQFKFENIKPYEFSQEITYTLYGTYEGVLFHSPVKTYSIVKYCANTFANPNTAEKTKTLIANLLNYGAAAQIYRGSYTDNLCNALPSVAEYVEAYQTTENPALTNIADKTFETVASPTLTWKGATLRLDNGVSMQFAFNTTEDLSDIEIRVYDEENELRQTFTSSDFIYRSDGDYHYIIFKKYGVSFMSKPAFVSAYKNGEKISDTYRYSVESYAALRTAGTPSTEAEINLKNLCIALMKYGNAAATLIG